MPVTRTFRHSLAVLSCGWVVPSKIAVWSHKKWEALEKIWIINIQGRLVHSMANSSAGLGFSESSGFKYKWPHCEPTMGHPQTRDSGFHLISASRLTRYWYTVHNWLFSKMICLTKDTWHGHYAKRRNVNATPSTLWNYPIWLMVNCFFHSYVLCYSTQNAS